MVYVCRVDPHRLHNITPRKRLILPPAHRKPVAPTPLRVAIIHRHLLFHAVLDRCAPDLRFPLFVPVEYVEQFLLVGFRFGFDGREGLVVGPQVGVAAVGVEGFGWDGGGGGGGRCRGLGGGRGGFWGSWGRRWSGRVFYGGLFGEEIPQAGIEVAEGVIVCCGFGGLGFVPEPAHGWLGLGSNWLLRSRREGGESVPRPHPKQGVPNRVKRSWADSRRGEWEDFHPSSIEHRFYFWVSYRLR